MKRTRLVIACSVVAMVACGEPHAPVGVGSSAPVAASVAPTTAPAASAAAAPAMPSAPPVVLPAGDPEILAELAKLTACSVPDVLTLSLCEAHVAWSKFSDELVEGGNPARAKALTTACLAATVHADASVRQAAYECIQTHAAHVTDAKVAVAHAIGRLPGEPRQSVRKAQISAIDELDPAKHGGGPELVAIARAIAAQRSTRDALEGIVDALRPEDDGEPAAEAFELARELLARRAASDEAVDLIAQSKARAAEACALFLAVAEKGDRAWWLGVRGLARSEGRCQAQRARAVEAALRHAEGGGPRVDDAWFGDAHGALERFFTDARLTEEQKASLKKAAEAQKSQATRPKHRERLDALLAALR